MSGRIYTPDEINENIDSINSRIAFLDNKKKISLLQEEMASVKELMDELERLHSESDLLTTKIQLLNYIGFDHSHMPNWKASLPEHMQRYAEITTPDQRKADIEQAEMQKKKINDKHFNVSGQCFKAGPAYRAALKEIASLEAANALLAEGCKNHKDNNIKESLQQELEKFQKAKRALVQSGPQFFSSSSSQCTSDYSYENNQREKQEILRSYKINNGIYDGDMHGTMKYDSNGRRRY